MLDCVFVTTVLPSARLSVVLGWIGLLEIRVRDPKMVGIFCLPIERVRSNVEEHNVKRCLVCKGWEIGSLPGW